LTAAQRALPTHGRHSARSGRERRQPGRAASPDHRIDRRAPRMELKVTPLGGGRFRLTTGPRVRLAHAVVDGPRTHVHLDGRIYVFEASGASRPARLAHEDEALALSAPMPATVVDIAVVPGDRVGRGDLL